MQIVKNFHKMETARSLFDLGAEFNFPVWDIIRVKVYVKYYYPKKDLEIHDVGVPHNPSHLINFLKGIVKLLYIFFFKKVKTIFFTASRYKNQDGLYFDKSAEPIMKAVANNYIALERPLGIKLAYPYAYDISTVLGRVVGNIFVSESVTQKYFIEIDKALVEFFGENLFTLQEMHNMLNQYKRSYLFYRTLFRLKGVKKIFIATGNPKAQLMAAKELGIKTYQIQHAGIEFDEIDYSYPQKFTQENNILFSDYLLTFGSYWCKNTNTMVKRIIPIGNDYFFSRPLLSSDDSILIISTIIHGGELSILALNLANLHPEMKIVFKLHPNEFHLVNKYLLLFSDTTNIEVVTDQISTNQLLARCKLVVLIVSAVLYEAVNQGKKVAIYKRINYERQLSLSHIPNLFFFDNASEISLIFEKSFLPSDVEFYKPTDYKMIKKLLTGSN